MTSIGENMDKVTDYIHDNYYDDTERLSKVKAVADLATTEHDYNVEALIDKVAMFNGIKKSYPTK